MTGLFKKFCKWALAAIGFTSFASCDEDGKLNLEKILPPYNDDETEILLMYGTPYSKFEVKCKVVDSQTGSPVKGLELASGYSYKWQNEKGEVEERFYKIGDAVETSDGMFEMEGNLSISQDDDGLKIKMTDKDPEKDGHYRDTIFVVPLSKTGDAPKEESWCRGIYGADVTLKAEQSKTK